MNTWIIGDIHGAAKALEDIIKKAEIDPQKDKIIFLGDICDYWPDTKEAIDILMGFDNLIAIRGNHDQWCLDYYKGELKLSAMDNWMYHGGNQTFKSLGEDPDPKYLEFLDSMPLYHINEDNHLFVHAGFDPKRPFSEQINPDFLMWDRSLIKMARSMKKIKGAKVCDQFEQIWVGHTPVQYWGDFARPHHWTNLWAMDTGAKLSTDHGRLSAVHLETGRIVQSKLCGDLYGKKSR